MSQVKIIAAIHARNTVVKNSCNISRRIPGCITYTIDNNKCTIKNTEQVNPPNDDVSATPVIGILMSLFAIALEQTRRVRSNVPQMKETQRKCN